MPGLEIVLNVVKTHAPVSGSQLLLSEPWLRAFPDMRKVNAVASCDKFRLNHDDSAIRRNATLGIVVVGEEVEIPKVTTSPTNTFTVLELASTGAKPGEYWLACGIDGMPVQRMDAWGSGKILKSLQDYYLHRNRHTEAGNPNFREITIEPEQISVPAIIDAARLAVMEFAVEKKIFESVA